MATTTGTRSTVLRFVLLIGIVNLFADLTYEGGRSIVGPYLGILGASAAIVGIVAGLGEFLGYALRSVSGWIADRTGKYWIAIFVGYVINMLAVPALALAGMWPLAAGLVVAERTGRAIRRPNVETMLSYTRETLGGGSAYGLNESLDQLGATIGPLIVAFVITLRGNLRDGFAMLIVPALLCLGMVVVARVEFPNPRQFEAKKESKHVKGFSRPYWFYLAAGALIAAGFADFALISFHFQQAKIVPGNWIPLYYAAAMAAGAVASFTLGRLFDRVGDYVLMLAFLVAALFAPLVFFGNAALALLGMVLWGIGMGAQDSLLKAVLSGVIPSGRRSTAFGFFDAGFGGAWFIGSAAMGLLYQISIPALVVFSLVLQFAAIPVFFWAWRARSSA